MLILKFLSSAKDQDSFYSLQNTEVKEFMPNDRLSIQNHKSQKNFGEWMKGWGKKKVEEIKNHDILTKGGNAKYLNYKSDDNLKQKTNTLRCLSKYPKIIEAVWRNGMFFQTVNIFHNFHFLFKMYKDCVKLSAFLDSAKFHFFFPLCTKTITENV